MFLCCIFISCSRIKINSFYNRIFTETRLVTLEKECDVKKILMLGKAIRHTCPKSVGDLGRTLRLISSFSIQVSQSLLRGKQNIIRPIFQCSTMQGHIYNNQCQPDHISDLSTSTFPRRVVAPLFCLSFFPQRWPTTRAPGHLTALGMFTLVTLLRITLSLFLQISEILMLFSGRNRTRLQSFSALKWISQNRFSKSHFPQSILSFSFFNPNF